MPGRLQFNLANLRSFCSDVGMVNLTHRSGSRGPFESRRTVTMRSIAAATLAAVAVQEQRQKFQGSLSCYPMLLLPAVKLSLLCFLKKIFLPTRRVACKIYHIPGLLSLCWWLVGWLVGWLVVLGCDHFLVQLGATRFL